MNTGYTLATLTMAVALVGLSSAQAQDLDLDIYADGVPEIINQEPPGTPVPFPVERHPEGVPEIDALGPESQPARTVVRDGECVPEIDQRGPSSKRAFTTRQDDREG